MRKFFKEFNELTPFELYKILQSREQVFNLEQNCLYKDLDSKDLLAFHLWYENEQEELTAYLRILPPGVSYPDWSIGRVLTSASARGKGLGKKIVKEAILKISDLSNEKFSIRISAQSYLEKFYADLGFVTTGKTYLEDDIPHTEMFYSLVPG